MPRKLTLYVWLFFCLGLVLGPLRAAQSDDKDAQAEENFLKTLNWTKGPAKADLNGIAQINIPEGFKLADGKSTQKLMKAMGNPVSGSEVGFLSPTSMVWFVVFSFSNVGYVKDDDKDKLDANAMLKSIKEGNEEANEERKKMGVPPLHVVGWDTPPRYNEKTHNLEWAIRGESEGSQVVNYNTRVLGRKGVMEIELIVDTDKLAGTLPEYQKILADYSFKSGESYAEYRKGDKVAEYGLAALVVGGAAVGAAKLGLFAWLAVAFKKAWKLVVIGFAAVASWIKKLFGGKSKTADEDAPPVMRND